MLRLVGLTRGEVQQVGHMEPQALASFELLARGGRPQGCRSVAPVYPCSMWQEGQAFVSVHSAQLGHRAWGPVPAARGQPSACDSDPPCHA